MQRLPVQKTPMTPVIPSDLILEGAAMYFQALFRELRIDYRPRQSKESWSDYVINLWATFERDRIKDNLPSEWIQPEMRKLDEKFSHELVGYFKSLFKVNINAGNAETYLMLSPDYTFSEEQMKIIEKASKPSESEQPELEEDEEEYKPEQITPIKLKRHPIKAAPVDAKSAQKAAAEVRKLEEQAQAEAAEAQRRAQEAAEEARRLLEEQVQAEAAEAQRRRAQEEAAAEAQRRAEEEAEAKRAQEEASCAQAEKERVEEEVKQSAEALQANARVSLMQALAALELETKDNPMFRICGSKGYFIKIALQSQARSLYEEYAELSRKNDANGRPLLTEAELPTLTALVKATTTLKQTSFEYMDSPQDPEKEQAYQSALHEYRKSLGAFVESSAGAKQKQERHATYSSCKYFALAIMGGVLAAVSVALIVASPVSAPIGILGLKVSFDMMMLGVGVAGALILGAGLYKDDNRLRNKHKFFSNDLELLATAQAASSPRPVVR